MACPWFMQEIYFGISLSENLRVWRMKALHSQPAPNGERRRLKGCLSALAVMAAFLVLPRHSQAQAPQPIVAIHDSELTRALESMVATNGTPSGNGTTGFQWWPTNWHYFVMPDSVKEALRSDGTAFAVLSDSNIAAGQLLNSNGLPNYPIFISLSSEAVADNEIGPLTNYVAAGGTLLAGGSSFTRNTNGLTRGDFAIANAMGLHLLNPNLANWAADVTFTKLTNHALISHIPGGALQWNMPVSADEISWGTSPSYSLNQGHLIWQVTASSAIVLAQGDTRPYLTLNSFGSGTVIYLAAMEPFLAHGGNAPGLFAYGILRNAIAGAFASCNLPVPKLSPWPFAYNAALTVRHDLENLQSQISSVAASAEFEYTNGARGDYYFCTGTLRVEMTNSPTVISNLCAAVTNYGAIIGPHNGGFSNINNFNLVLSNYDYWHWATDEGLGAPATNVPAGFTSTTNYAFQSTLNSFLDVDGWLGSLTNGLHLTVAPHFNATREASYQMELQLGVRASGEQKLGIFPSWVLSTSIQTPDMRYPFISAPPSEWYIAPSAAGQFTIPVAQSMENNFGDITIRQLVDFYYNWGGQVNLYSHSSSAGGGQSGTNASDYVTYSMSKPRMWATNAAGVFYWWLARSNAQISAAFSTNTNRSVLSISIRHATDPQTAVEFLAPRPSVSALTVATNGVLAGANVYRTNGPTVKVQVGVTVTNVQVSYFLNPSVQTNFYSVPAGGQLTAAAPGLLTNALPGAGANLSASLVVGPANGSLSLTNNGGFAYAPANGFAGIDTFTFFGGDTLTTSAVSQATVDVTPATDLFYDNFLRPTNADPLAPWIPVQGYWSISGGKLQGSDPDPGAYDDAYVPGNWTNFSVQAQIQFPANGFGGGLDGRVNPLNGAKYTVVAYPNGIPGETASPLLKFHGWQMLGSTPMQQAVLPTIGTNVHTLTVVFHTNQIFAYWDGVQALSAVDNNFDGLAPFTSGGVGAHFFTYQQQYVASYQNMTVSTAPVAANASYTAVQNQALTVATPGVLAYDEPGLGSNLTALLAGAPTNGSLTLNSNGGFIYTPAPNYVGADSFTYQATDGSGTSSPALVSITVISNAPPVANNDSYPYAPNTPLTIGAPGVLANDTDPNGTALSASLVSGPAFGALTLNSDGSFSYAAATNFTGNDSFTYFATDGTLTSAVATVTLSDPANGALYFDNFIRTNSSIFPWIAEAGTWQVSGGMLQGSNLVNNAYAVAYLTNTWNDYSVQAQLQFGLNGYGGGLGGRVNPTNGARYAAWIYPSANNLHLIKFTAWTSPIFLTSTSLSPVGTNWHTLKLAMEGNQVAVYYDGTLRTNYADNASPLTNGGVSVESFNNNFAYQLLVSNVVVAPLAVPDDYLMTENGTLTVPASGVLFNDTGVYGTNLTAALVSGPANGVLTLASNGGFTYTPTPYFVGADSFTYQANDPETNLGSAPVTIMVNAGGPTLPAQTNLTITEFATLEVTNTAADPASPPQVLSYSLLSPPLGAVINSNGIISWTPDPAEAPSTNAITTVVSDSSTPPISATNTFIVTVVALPPPQIQSFSVTGAVANLVWSSLAGYSYLLQYKTNLTDSNWISLPPPVLASGPTSATNACAGAPQRFYRVILLP
jgi:hypothetical protein